MSNHPILNFVITGYGIPHTMGYVPTRDGVKRLTPWKPQDLMDLAQEEGLSGIEIPLTTAIPSFDGKTEHLDDAEVDIAAELKRRGMRLVADYGAILDHTAEHLIDIGLVMHGCDPARRRGARHVEFFPRGEPLLDQQLPQSREFRTGQGFTGPHRDRQVGVAKQLFSAMGIERDDKDKRQDWVLRGFRQFDAPVCVIVTYDRVLDGSDDTPFDCGAVATALVNAAWSRGLGAVINSQGIMQSPVVREHAGIADDQIIMKSIALGWPDESFPANAVVSERKSVEEATVFVGFDN